jgi:SAM-dependent methyltransferase
MSSLQSPSTFDEYAGDYDATVQAAIGASGEPLAYFAELKAKFARAEAPSPTRRALDFGCGTGNATRALAQALPAARIAGFDPSADSINVARTRTDASIEFATSTDSRLPYGDGTFDLVIAACVFHHIEAAQQPHWAREIARVLRPGGRFVMFEHNPLNPLTRRVVRQVPFDQGVVLLPRGYATRLLAATGLRPRRGRYYFFFPRFLAAFRRLEPLLGWLPFGAQFYVVGER